MVLFFMSCGMKMRLKTRICGCKSLTSIESLGANFAGMINTHKSLTATCFCMSERSIIEPHFGRIITCGLGSMVYTFTQMLTFGEKGIDEGQVAHWSILRANRAG